MSRAAAAASSQAQPIWQLTINTPQGLLRTFRTQQLGSGRDSFQIGEGVLAIVTQFLLDYANCRNKFKNTCETPNLGKFARSGLSINIWINILNIALGFDASYSLQPSLQTLRQAATAHLLSRNKLNLLRAAPSLFPVIPIHPNQLIEAILHGDEKMVCDIINAAPELLLEKGTAIDLQGRPFTGTPLQAAIAADDIAPNKNSTGTVEIILEKLKQFDPEHYRAIFEKQACELYKESLSVYISMQERKIARFREFGSELQDNDPLQTGINEKMRQARANLAAYADALCSDDLNMLFETHKKAQADNAFDFRPYIDAIRNAPQAELDDVMALITAKEEETKAVIARTGVASRESDDCRNKLFDSLTLVQKLNRFREKLAEHMRREIIFNPQHISTGLNANRDYRVTQGPDFDKHRIIFSQLCGFAQRLASEPVKQDIRQGTGYLRHENERRTRQSCFNRFDFNIMSYVAKNSLVDVSISSIVDGVGYKFAVGQYHTSVCAPQVIAIYASFLKLMRDKYDKLSELITPEAQSTPSRIMPNKYDKLSELIMPEAQSTDCSCIIQ